LSTDFQYQVLDLFAGPGGLGEGFSRCVVNGERPFSIALSVEMDSKAHHTLRLRSFYRQFTGTQVPELYYCVIRGESDITKLAEQYPLQWNAAENEALLARLGDGDKGDKEVRRRIRKIKSQLNGQETVLLGGPPCQAYSLVGRARNSGISSYVPEQDHRHQLYVEYLKIIKEAWPVAFVMENVKGILSSKLDSELIFPKILKDLKDPRKALGRSSNSKLDQRYRLYSVAIEGTNQLHPDDDSDPSSFVVRCERFGVPQRRHRVFILGIRKDIEIDHKSLMLSPSSEITVRDLLEDIPPVLSGVSQREQGGNWEAVLAKASSSGIAKQIEAKAGVEVGRMIRNTLQELELSVLDRGGDFVHNYSAGKIRSIGLAKWIRDPRIGGFCNHSTRSHMQSDLIRYMYAASYASEYGFSPTLAEFPTKLMPNHRNAAESVRGRSLFADRFRVQVWDQPSTTITSHISKDGHYFIHPDPSQCRSLTVREAARLQTFPDNYFFCGPRTSQFTQVGNAVPPYIARQIASRLAQSLTEFKAKHH
jgi:DNA (cytosine-5)-methyltransferase 1